MANKLLAGLWLLVASTAQAGWLEQNNYQLQASISLDAVNEDASGLAFDPVRQRLWLVADNAYLYELSPAGEVLRRIQLKGFEDPEGISWLGHDAGNTRLAISEERRGEVLAIEVNSHSTTLDYRQAKRLASFGKQASNNGIEGLAVASQGQIFAVSEQNPQAVYRIDAQGITELWRIGWLDFWREPLDYAGLAYVPQTHSLLVVSDRSRELREYDLQGNTLGRLKLDAS
ncbi:MAG: SdiA-regulated domain-containing protein, partial [Nevskiales bacterium]